jgi:hypothetical protein
MASIVLNRNPKEHVEDANAEGDTATAHNDNRQPRVIESKDLVRPSQNAGLMPKLNQ